MPIDGSVAGQSSPRCLSFAVIGLSVPLLWIIFTLRKVQEEMSEDIGHEHGGNELGFGQIVSSPCSSLSQLKCHTDGGLGP